MGIRKASEGVPPFRLGLFGGTFDPPHIGHLVVAQDAAEELDLDLLLFVPARDPPHKDRADLSPAAIRLEMTRAAVGTNEGLGVSDVELEREGPSYTVDTLEFFRGEHPDAEIFFLMGTDQLMEIHLWHEAATLPHLAGLVAMSRPGIDPEASVPAIDIEFRRIPVTWVDISSTGIRDRVRDGRSIQYLVPSPVRDIIDRNALYRDGESRG
jgi:nicotinate-nucleotide adenylyltransferase